MLKRRPAGKKFTNQNQNINIIQYTEEKKLSLQSNVVIRLSSMDGRIQDFQMINFAATASLESVRALLDPWSDDFSDPCCWPVCTVSLVSLSPRDKHYQIWWWCQWVSVHPPCHSVWTVSGLVSPCEPSQAYQIQILDHTEIKVDNASDGLGGTYLDTSALCHHTCQAVKLSSLRRDTWQLMKWQTFGNWTESRTRECWNPLKPWLPSPSWQFSSSRLPCHRSLLLTIIS